MTYLPMQERPLFGGTLQVPTYLPAYIPTVARSTALTQVDLPTYLSTYLSTYLPTYRQSIVKCMNCETNSRSLDPIEDLVLEIQEGHR